MMHCVARCASRRRQAAKKQSKKSGGRNGASSAARKIESESSSLLFFVGQQDEQARVDHAKHEPYRVPIHGVWMPHFTGRAKMTPADHHEGGERDYCQHFLFSVHRHAATTSNVIATQLTGFI